MISPVSPRRLSVWAAVVLLTTAEAHAQAPLHQRIDQLIAAKPDFARKVSGPATDAEFLRRIYLDLIGTIPTAVEARAFLREAAPDKRERLVDRLLASPEHARHLAQVLDVLLMERIPGKAVPQDQWHEYLRTSVAANKPWDQLVREILSADGSDPKNRAPARFYLERSAEPHLLTRDVSRLLLGMDLQCAQCHDHPIVTSYHQSYYYGLYAFLDRTSVVTDKARKLAMLSEKADGETTYQSVFDPSKTTKTTMPRVLDLSAVKDPPLVKGKEYVKPPVKGAVSIPTYSRRGKLAEQLTDAGNVAFRRNIANRLWAMMMGRGLVHPLDMIHPDNPPSHPELLDLLTQEMAATKFDMRGFLRQLALSQTYQRSSEVKEGVVESDPAAYTAALLKPLTSEQLAWSLMQATGLTDTQRAALGAKLNEASLHAVLARTAAPVVGAFASEPGEPESFDATIEQALFITNGPLVRSWVKPRSGNLTDRVSKLKTSEEAAEELYLSIYTRLPDEQERKDIEQFLAEQNNRALALEEIIWAMLASTEFRFNH